jgi:4-amino-4-deoxy-L-arabinose transferase-like glycosyltransferase
MNHKKEYLIICLIVIIIQLLFAIPVFQNINRAMLPIADAMRYDHLARNLIEQHTYSRDTVPPYRPESFVPPGYPSFIAFFYSIFGKNPIPIIIIQIILSCFIAVISFLFALQFIQNRNIAFITGILFGLSPNFAFHSTKLISESLFTFLLLLSLYLIFIVTKYKQLLYHNISSPSMGEDKGEGETRSISTPSPTPPIKGGEIKRSSNRQIILLLLAGFIFGLATYVRTISIYFPILIMLIFLIWQKKIGVRPISILGFILIFALTLTPWIIRNTIVFKKPIFATTAEWNIFLYNASTVIASEKNIDISDAQDTIWSDVEKVFAANPELDTTNDVIRAQLASQAGLKYIIRSPLTYAKIHATSFLLNFIVPIGISPLIQYITAKPLTDLKMRPRVMQDALALLARGKIKQAVDLVFKERFYNLSSVGFLILLWAAIFQLFIMVGVIISLVRLFKKTYYLLIPILYFTLATGPVSDARLRVPIEPLLIILAAIGYFSQKHSEEKIHVFQEN